MSNIFKMSHYANKNEKLVLVPKEVNILKLPNFDELEAIDDESHVLNEGNEILTQAHAEAANIINRAQMESTALKENALQEIAEWKKNEQLLLEEEGNRLRSKAKEDGYQEGYQSGVNEGTKAAHNQYIDLIEHAGLIVKQTEVDWKKRLEQSEPFLVDLSIEIARKIILRELSLDQNTLLGMVTETLKLSSELKEITLAVHPDDYQLLRSRMDELKSLISSQANLIVLPDHTITSGGCIIRSSLGTLDARIDTQLEEIKVALLDAIKGSEMDELEPHREI